MAILRAIGVDPFGRPPQGPDALKPGTIARAVGLTPETVRERLQRLEDSGFIAGYQAFVNLRHFGLRGTSFLFSLRDEGRRDEVLPALQPVEGVLAVHAFLGPDVCVDLTYRGEGDLARRLHVLGSLTGDPAPTGFQPLEMPPVRRPLTHLDWRLVRALRGRAKRPLAEVAEELGVGYRTVKRHYDRLCTEGSLYVVPLLDPGKGPGLIPFWLLFFLAPSADADLPARLAKTFDDRRIVGFFPTNVRLGNYAIMLVADRPAQMEDLRRQGAALPGVARATVLVPVDLRDCSGWMDDIIAAKVEETALQPSPDA